MQPTYRGQLAETDTAFDELQLDLPLRLRPDVPEEKWSGEFEWPTPQRVLAQYLREIGVTQPGRISKRLLNDFGTISNILSASWWRLRRSAGLRLAGNIRASRDLVRLALFEKVVQGPVISSASDVTQLLSAHLGSLKRERLLALYVDRSRHLLRIARIADGSPSETPLHIGRIIQSGFEVGAAGILLVHNHPSGDATASESDKLATDRLRRVAADVEMDLIDHLIVAGGEVRSVGGF